MACKRVQEILEVRVPKGKAYLAEEDGVIEDIEERKTLKVVQLKISSKGKGKKAKIIEYSIPRTATVFIKSGDMVKKRRSIIRRQY